MPASQSQLFGELQQAPVNNGALLFLDNFALDLPNCHPFHFLLQSCLHPNMLSETHDLPGNRYGSMSCVQQGLTQHLEASHDLFVYGYPDDVNALRVISVEPKDDIYSSTGHFQSLEANILKDPVNKVGLTISGSQLRHWHVHVSHSHAPGHSCAFNVFSGTPHKLACI